MCEATLGDPSLEATMYMCKIAVIRTHHVIAWSSIQGSAVQLRFNSGRIKSARRRRMELNALL